LSTAGVRSYTPGDEYEAVGLRNRGGPSPYDLVRVRRTTWKSRRRRLIEERHRKIAKIEKSSVDTLAILKVLQNPLRGLFRETALPSASNNHGNNGHDFTPCCSPKEKSLIKEQTVSRPTLFDRRRF
jgi:hypothetical protein